MCLGETEKIPMVFIRVDSQKIKRLGIDCLLSTLRLSMLSEQFYTTLNQTAVRFGGFGGGGGGEGGCSSDGGGGGGGG